MTDTFQLEIVTPEKLVVKDSAEEAQIPATTGYIGVLPGHAPLITELGAGDAHFRTAESVISLMLLIGFLNTLPGFMDTLWGFIRYPLGVYRHI